MTKLSPLEKETRFLFEKHNKRTKFPLEIEEIVFPENIIKILEKKTKRTDNEAKRLANFRGKVLCELEEKSYKLWCEYEEKKIKKRKSTQQKLAKSKDVKYKNDSTKIKHFGVWFENDENVRISRNTYAIIDKKVYQKPSPTMRRFYNKNPLIHALIYEDFDCTTYNDTWCEQHRQDCLENFDLNLNFCSQIEDKDFEKALSDLLKKEKDIKQIFDLYECDRIEGVYILVLDKYKQLYIGQSKDIKKRILQHWRKKKEFDSLLCGNINSSVLSIDAFGCLDTTRIFVLETWDFCRYEIRLLQAIDDKYVLNRTAGGIYGNDLFTKLEIAANRNIRKL